MPIASGSLIPRSAAFILLGGCIAVIDGSQSNPDKGAGDASSLEVLRLGPRSDRPGRN